MDEDSSKYEELEREVRHLDLIWEVYCYPLDYHALRSAETRLEQLRWAQKVLDSR
jgi:hypothetical protein